MPQDSPSGFTSPFLPTADDIEGVRELTRCSISPPETSKLRTVVSIAPDELKRYDAEIAVVARELDRLRAERAMPRAVAA
ncbi:hypothetical protein R3P38DRAFT_3222928 [Favolaschia claudopus]|uniref:Uncharacterized protein n=1 Tax=Favolaschia claudopus TaxID=2862362 RepID=A0AAV9ZXH7_9AGAR